MLKANKWWKTQEFTVMRLLNLLMQETKHRLFDIVTPEKITLTLKIKLIKFLKKSSYLNLVIFYYNYIKSWIKSLKKFSVFIYNLNVKEKI